MPIHFDQLNRKVEIPQNPKRIISLVPSISHLLVDLGKEKQLVGITKFCVDPPTMKDKTNVIGGTKKQDFKKIDKLQPDLIIANKEENTKEEIEQLAEKYTVWVSDVRSVSDSIAMIYSLGKILGAEKKADKIIDSISKGFKKVKRKAKKFEQKYTAGYFIWHDPYMVAGRSNIINSVMKYAGFENVFNSKNSLQMQEYLKDSKGNKHYPQVSIELIRELNPEYILLSSEPYPFNEKHIEEFASILPEAKILLVPGEMFSWYGSKLIESAEYLLNLQTIISAKS
jgi:ABC-type Fe3+-hydroxamate transport system substrate-binding protein